MGFDFYAPQSFEDEKKRRILIGWAGIGGADYDNEPTVRNGWQHALTVPRELHYSEESGRIRQYPVKEFEELREDLRMADAMTDTELPQRSADIVAEELSAETILADQEEALLFRILSTREELFRLDIVRRGKEYVLILSVASDAGRGRTQRKVPVKELRDLRLLLDTSLAEIYVNDGEIVMTTRFYAPESTAAEAYHLSLGKLQVKVWDMKAMTVLYEEA